MLNIYKNNNLNLESVYDLIYFLYLCNKVQKKRLKYDSKHHYQASLSKDDSSL